MEVELDNFLPVLLGVVLVLLWGGAARRLGPRAWLVLGVALMIAFAANPDRGQHTRAVERRASFEIHDPTRPIVLPAMTEFRSGHFAAVAEYHNFGVASAVTFHGRLLSVGVVGKVWTVDLNRLLHSLR